MTRKSDSVTFEAGGHSYTVRMVPSAWIELEDAGLGNVHEVASSLQKSASFKILLRILHAGLKHKHAALTADQVAALADEIGSEALLSIVTVAIQSSFPEPKAGNDQTALEQAGEAQATTGTGISS